jgi:2-succinyl-6-hydroxy-2,4-cyclohexadiene-1-carboxylate synthase
VSPRSVFAHGFTQTGRSWDQVRALLSLVIPDVSSVAVDLPGHGDAAGVTTDLWGAADHLVAQGGPGVYVGYSMGGRVSLHAVLAHPESVEGLVLIGATGGIDDEQQRIERRAADEQLAERVEEIGVEAFIDAWLANPLFAGLDEASAMRHDRLRNSAEGLASSLRTCGTGTQEPVWTRLGEIRCPTRVVVGENDTKFTELGERLVSEIRDSEMVIIPDCGHSVALEDPAAVTRVVAELLVDLS